MSRTLQRILMSDDDPTLIGSARPAHEPHEAHEAHEPRVPGDADATTRAHGNALPPGTRVQEFQIEGLVGEGGFSVVYRAHDTLLGRTIALKEYMPASLAMRSGERRVVPRTERLRATFELGLRSFVNEARLLASFDHPALVKVYRFWEDNGTAYLVMPLYHGPTLREWLALEGGRAGDEGALLHLLHPLLDALEVMHAQQCYHRDIAPDNILLLEGDGRDGRDGAATRFDTPRLRPLLLDFGAARRVIGGATQALTVILKPGYAPIEQYAETPQARQGPWTDIYALCATLYDAVTGRVPEPSVGRLMHDGLEPASVAAHGMYSRALLAAIDRGMAVKPSDRPQSVQALRALLPGPDGSVPASAGDAVGEAHDRDATVILDAAQARAVFDAARGGAGAKSTATRDEPRATSGTREDVSSASPMQPPRDPARRQRTLLVAATPAVAIALIAGAWWWATSPSITDPGMAGPITTAGAPTTSNPPGSSATPVSSTSPPAVSTDASQPPTTSAATAAPPVATVTPTVSTPPFTPPATAPFTVLAALRDIAAGADASIDVEVQATKPRLVIGRDDLGFTVRSSQPGHVYVFASGSDQSHFHLLFPNPHDTRNRIEARRTLTLPRPEWALTSSGPPGTNHLLVVVSRSPRSFDGTGLVRKAEGIPRFDLGDAAARWAERPTGAASPFIGRAACARGTACAEGYGAGMLEVDEVVR